MPLTSGAVNEVSWYVFWCRQFGGVAGSKKAALGEGGLGPS